MSRRSSKLGALVLAVACAASLSGVAGADRPLVARGEVPPTQGVPPPTAIGKTEGSLDLLAAPGFASPQWTTPFRRATGCRVSVTVAASSSAIERDMSEGGTRSYDLIAAQNDAALSLIYAGAVRPVNLSLLPAWGQEAAALQSPDFNTVVGYHYGITSAVGLDELVFYKASFSHPPSSWLALYAGAPHADVGVPNEPLVIADAAVYLSRVRPKLKITDPYELTAAQFDATVAALRTQHKLVRSYWTSQAALASLLASRAVIVAQAPLAAASRLLWANAKLGAAVPTEGTTAQAVSWMMDAQPRHPNCAYRWLRWVGSAKVQAQLAISLGQMPASKQACREMDRIRKGSCAALLAAATPRELSSLRFVEIPSRRCADGRAACTPYAAWQRAWTRLRT